MAGFLGDNGELDFLEDGLVGALLDGVPPPACGRASGAVEGCRGRWETYYPNVFGEGEGGVENEEGYVVVEVLWLVIGMQQNLKQTKTVLIKEGRTMVQFIGDKKINCTGVNKYVF